MKGNAPNRFLRIIPSVTLLATSFFTIVAGLGFVGFAIFRAAGIPGNANGAFATIALGIGLVIIGAGSFWTAAGVWRVKPVAVHLGVVVAACAVGLCLLTVPTALKPLTVVFDPATGTGAPMYDSGAMLIGLAGVPYALALACLLLIELSLHRQAQGDKSTQATT